MYSQNSDKNSISFLFATKSNRPPKSLSYTVAKQGINKAQLSQLFRRHRLCRPKYEHNWISPNNGHYITRRAVIGRLELALTAAIVEAFTQEAELRSKCALVFMLSGVGRFRIRAPKFDKPEYALLGCSLPDIDVFDLGPALLAALEQHSYC
jgi:hypothetical protein